MGVVGEPGSGVAGAVDELSSVPVDVTGLAGSGVGERRSPSERSEAACFNWRVGLSKRKLATLPR